MVKKHIRLFLKRLLRVRREQVFCMRSGKVVSEICQWKCAGTKKKTTVSKINTVLIVYFLLIPKGSRTNIHCVPRRTIRSMPSSMKTFWIASGKRSHALTSLFYRKIVLFPCRITAVRQEHTTAIVTRFLAGKTVLALTPPPLCIHIGFPSPPNYFAFPKF